MSYFDMADVMRESDARHMAQEADSCYETVMERRATDRRQSAKGSLNAQEALFGTAESAAAPAALQAGLLPTFRIFLLVTTVTPVLAWRILESELDIHAPVLRVVMPEVALSIFLLFYTSIPWFRRKMGRAFFPVALILKATHPILGSYLAMVGFVPPNFWE